MVQYLRAANVKDGVLDLSDVKSMDFDPKEQATFALRPGDVLVTEGSGSLSAVGASSVWRGEIPGVICFQNTLLRLRPRPRTDPRFLGWWCRHAFADGLFAAIATGANIHHVSAERVRSLPMRYLQLPDQRAIADYLDTETARIDALITKKRRMIELLEEEISATIEEIVWGSSYPSMPLKRLVPPSRKIMYGIVLPGPNVDNGALLVKGGDIKAGRLSPDLLSRTSRDIEVKYVRSRVRTGDILFAIRGGVGDVEIAPSCIDGANITQDVARISPIVDVDVRWLIYALRSSSVQRDVGDRITGATIRGINIEELERVRVPMPPLDDQRRLGSRLEARSETIFGIVASMRRQLDLLAEHRQALITAAVTGELEIPEVA